MQCMWPAAILVPAGEAAHAALLRNKRCVSLWYVQPRQEAMLEQLCRAAVAISEIAASGQAFSNGMDLHW